jgi:hypothetical protein
MESNKTNWSLEINMDVQYLEYFIETITNLFKDDKFLKCFELVNLIGMNIFIIEFIKINLSNIIKFIFTLYKNHRQENTERRDNLCIPTKQRRPNPFDFTRITKNFPIYQNRFSYLQRYAAY